MKNKKSALVMGIALIGAVAFSWVSKATQKPLSELELANIEALTQIELPGVVITCTKINPHGGQCYEPTDETRECDGNMYQKCRFNGMQYSYCYIPCL